MSVFISRRANVVSYRPRGVVRLRLLGFLPDRAFVGFESARAEPARSARPSRLAVEISRVGNNLNQLAHHANAHNTLPAERALTEATARIIASLDKVLAL